MQRGQMLYMNKRKKTWLFLFGLTVLIILMGLGIWWIKNEALSYNYVDLNKTDEELGIEKPVQVKELPVDAEQSTDESVEENEKIVHIALFGVDKRKNTDVGRSDSIMIGTLDFKHDKIKLTSVMRDLYVAIDEHGYDKINHAYAYGGAELAIKTLNQNFGLDIREYVTVDFYALEKMIDQIGGIELDIKPDEVSLINKYSLETARLQNKEHVPLIKAGKQLLNGQQAVAYARIRAVGNGDFERTSRQRIVLKAMIEKVSNADRKIIPSLILNILPHVETSLSYSELLSLAKDYFQEENMEIVQNRFPLDGTYKGTRINGIYYLQTDLEQLKEQAYEYFYNTKVKTEEMNDVVSTHSIIY